MTQPEIEPERPQFDIPDDALVVRFGRGTRELYDRACAKALQHPRLGYSAFSVRAAIGLSAEAIHAAPPQGPWKEWVTTTGLHLRKANLQSRKTFSDPLHYSVICPDGITDEVWAILEELFR